MLFIFLLAFVVNVALYIGLKPIVYDGLRHYLFLLPIIVFCASVYLIDWLRNPIKGKFKAVLVILLVVNVAKVSVEMVQLHPYQYIYFNELVGGLPGAYGKFETEYMGASHKESIDWLRANIVTDQNVYVRNCGHHFSGMYHLKDNFIWTEKLETANYFVCYTRFNQHEQVPEENTIHIVERQGVPLNYVKKI